MAKKKKDTVEFRFYEIPQGESALILCGSSWRRVYGHENMNLHFHNLMEIGICREGEGIMYMDEERVPYTGGCLTVIPENFPHITISAGEDENFWEYVFFDLKSMANAVFPDNPVYQEEVLKVLNKKGFLLEPGANETLVMLVNAIIAEEKEALQFGNKMIHYYIKALVTELVRSNKHMPSISESRARGSNMAQIAAALSYINENYAEKIKASDLASICGMSETHFRRVFEEYIQMTPIDYVNLCRIQKACEFMRKTNDSMDLIASKCGFTTTSTFNRNFKKFLETSPYQWKINPSNYENKLLNYHISALKGW
ncbi:MAG: AraC family transcriptional regulator [bacterium]|nr:AraC family transcriptional regulator [bacterium]